MYEVKDSILAHLIAEREGVPNIEREKGVSMLRELSMHRNPCAEARVQSVTSTFGDLHRAKESNSPYRIVFRCIDYNAEVQAHTGLKGVIRVFGYYTRDSETYSRIYLDWSD